MVFDVTLSEPNNVADEYAPNNVYFSEFEAFPRYEGDLKFKYKTNNNAFENSWKLFNMAGDLVYEKGNFTPNTTYTDELQLSPGCYSLEVYDTGGDGFSFFASPGQGSRIFPI